VLVHKNCATTLLNRRGAALLVMSKIRQKILSYQERLMLVSNLPRIILLKKVVNHIQKKRSNIQAPMIAACMLDLLSWNLLGDGYLD
jgi:hypothetical protein